jgi:hypothetical protein
MVVENNRPLRNVKEFKEPRLSPGRKGKYTNRVDYVVAWAAKESHG